MSNRRDVLKGLFGLLLLPWTTGPAPARPRRGRSRRDSDW